MPTYTYTCVYILFFNTLLWSNCHRKKQLLFKVYNLISFLYRCFFIVNSDHYKVLPICLCNLLLLLASTSFQWKTTELILWVYICLYFRVFLYQWNHTMCPLFSFPSIFLLQNYHFRCSTVSYIYILCVLSFAFSGISKIVLDIFPCTHLISYSMWSFCSTFLNTVKIATCFLLLTFERSCGIFTRFLYSIDACNYFPRVWTVFLISLTVSFLKRKHSLILMESYLFLIDCALDIKTKKCLPFYCHF